MSLGWDDELPAGYQDADIELREFEDQAREFYGEDIFGDDEVVGDNGVDVVSWADLQRMEQEPSGRYSREELDASFGESRFDV